MGEGGMCAEPVIIESTPNLFMTAYPRMVEIFHLLVIVEFHDYAE